VAKKKHFGLSRNDSARIKRKIESSRHLLQGIPRAMEEFSRLLDPSPPPEVATEQLTEMGPPMQKKEIATALGVSVKTLNLLIRKNTYRIVSDSHKNYRIDLRGLPPEIRAKFFSKP
jgi:hypothetical protein